MFFTIDKFKDVRFPNFKTFGKIVVSYDNGWIGSENRLFKGYKFNFTESWIELKFENDVLYLNHSKLRPFPLWRNNQVITSLKINDLDEPIWVDQTNLRILQNLKIEFNFLPFINDFKIVPTTKSEVIDAILKSLISKIKEINQMDFDPKIFITGGIDTVGLFSALLNNHTHFEIIDYEHLEYDYFINTNFNSIKDNHWAYNQLHHWKNPTVLISGAYGDEYFMRGPNTISLWASWNDINIIDLLKKSNGYHVKYFLKESNLKIFEQNWKNRSQIKELYPTKQDLFNQILNININDHQHWHLGNTITWTPYQDLEYTKLILGLNDEELLKQIIDANINKEIIRFLNSDCLKLLSEFKNYKSRENLKYLNISL